MPVTTSYNLGHTVDFGTFDATSSTNLASLDLTSLANGGVAFVGDHLGYGHVDVGVGSEATGSLMADNIATGSNAAIDQLQSGNLVIASESGGNIFWEQLTDTGGNTGVFGNLGVTGSLNADVAALTGGGFVVAYEKDFGATDHDVLISVRDAAGAELTAFAMDNNGFDDRNVSVAGLRDGGFAVTWERDGVGGTSAAWSAIFNFDGGFRVAPHETDSAGGHNSAMSVVGLAKGGYAVAYTDSAWAASDHITLAIYTAQGHLRHALDVSPNATGDESEAYVTQLPDGTIAVAWSHQSSPSDHDIYLQLVDPKSGHALLPEGPVPVSSSGVNEHGATVAALGGGQVLVNWVADGFGAEGATLPLLIDREGDDNKNHIIGSGAYDTINGFGSADLLKGGGADDTIDGGAGKDIINGQAGADSLTGGLGKDIFQFSKITDVTVADVITDLQDTDHVNLTAIDADSTTGGNQAFHLVAAFSAHAGEAVLDFDVTRAGYTTLSLDTDGDGFADGRIQMAGDHSTFAHFVL